MRQVQVDNRCRSCCIFSLQGEQEEYVREGIKWSYVDFVDNQETLDLLEGGSGGSAALGVFPLIDEANRIARATYQAGPDRQLI